MAKPQRQDLVDHALMFQGAAVPVQILRWSGTRAQVTAGAATSAATAVPAGAKVVEIRATEDCYIRFGDNAVAAAANNTSSLFLRGAQTVVTPLDTDNVPWGFFAAIRAGANDAVVQLERVS